MSSTRAPALRERLAGFGSIDAGAATAFLLFGCLSFQSRQPEQLDLWIFLAIIFGAWAALLGAYAVAGRDRRPGLRTRIIAWAVALRLVGLFADPVFEDDFHRYLWDGRIFALTGNPYDKPPADSFGDPGVPPRFQEVLDHLNHPDAPTIYGPMCQFSFLIGYWILPGQLIPLKVLLIAAELLTLHWLLKLTTARNAILYAWCPLAVIETSFNAHPDALGVCFMIGALVFARSAAPMKSALLASLAIGTRVFGVLLAPFAWGRRPARQGAVMLCVLTSLYLPFVLRGSMGELSGLRQFASEWEFNSLAFAGLSYCLGFQGAQAAAAVLFALLYAGYFAWWRRNQLHDRIPRGELIFGCFFLLSPVVNPWYLLWIAPFVAIAPSATGITALAVVSLSYVHGLHLPGLDLPAYAHPVWVRWVEAGALVAALAYDLHHRMVVARLDHRTTR